MKRILVTLTVLSSLFSMSSFANEEINSKVLESFKNTFGNATEVDWTVNEEFYKVNFALNGQYVVAYFDGTGQLIGATRNISSVQLPIALQTNLKKHHEDYWITDLFEVANEEGTSYYVTLENADTKLVLKSGSSGWTTFQKQRKS